MKIHNLNPRGDIYTSNVYLVTGSWNTLNDVNTLIDVGRDPAVIPGIYEISTGVGKSRVEQVVLTHSHYDHSSLLPKIREAFHPQVYAFTHSLEGVDHLLQDGDCLKIGDRHFEVIHTPGHSNDSICLYCEEERVLFAGDAPLIVFDAGGTYEKPFLQAMQKLTTKEVSTIYFGHGSPLLQNCREMLRLSLSNMLKGRIISG